MHERCVMVAAVLVAVMVPAVTATVSAQSEKIEAGKKIYAAQKCTTCHAIGGVGSKVSSSLDGVGTKLTAAQIKEWIVNPAPLIAKVTPKPKVNMKKYVLPDADLDALVAYLASLKK